MPEPVLRTRIRVRFPEGTVIELERDPDRSVGDLVLASIVGAYWAPHAKFLVRDKHVDPGSDIDPPEVRYELELLGASPASPAG